MMEQLAPELQAMMDFASHLRDALPIDDVLTLDDQVELVRRMHVRKFKAGEVIYHQGDLATDAHVVHAGLVKELLVHDDGDEALMTLRRRGEFFGELALFRPGPRDTTAVAVIDTTTCQLSRESCQVVLARNAKAREWMFTHLTLTIQKLEDRYESMVFLDVPGRLACYLLELKAISADLPIRQDDLASAIGSTRVTVNKLLADFERRGLVRVSRRKFEIVNSRALEMEMQH